MRRQHLIAFLFVALAASACIKPRSVRVQASHGSNAYHAASPASLSEYIRAVMSVSEDNTALEQLHKARPDLAELARSSRDHPGDVESRHILAEAYISAGLYVNALSVYEEIVAAAPEDAQAELGLAGIWDKWGNPARAREHAERARRFAPDRAETLDLLGRICLHQGDADSALRAFQSALRIEPEDSRNFANAGYASLLQGDLNGARDYLEHALSIDDSIDEAHNHLGIVLAQLDEREAALRQFEAAGNPAAALNNLGTVYMAQNRLEEARRQFREALRLQPDYALARENLRNVESLLPPPALYFILPVPARSQTAELPANPISPDLPALSTITPASITDANGTIPLRPEETTADRRGGDAHPRAAAVKTSPIKEHPRTEASAEFRSSTDSPDSYIIQVCAVRLESDAEAIRDRLSRQALSPQISRVDLKRQGIWYRVRLCGYNSFLAAGQAARALISRGLISDFWIIGRGSTLDREYT